MGGASSSLLQLRLHQARYFSVGTAIIIYQVLPTVGKLTCGLILL